MKYGYLNTYVEKAEEQVKELIRDGMSQEEAMETVLDLMEEKWTGLELVLRRRNTSTV